MPTTDCKDPHNCVMQCVMQCQKKEKRLPDYCVNRVKGTQD